MKSNKTLKAIGDNGVVALDIPGSKSPSTPSGYLSKFGVRMKDFSSQTGESRANLGNWYSSRPRRFNLLLSGVLYERILGRFKLLEESGRHGVK